jgi:hypothetical protein
MLAAGRCSTETLQRLLEYGADAHAVATGGLTAPTFVEMEGRYDVIVLLQA